MCGVKWHVEVSKNDKLETHYSSYSYSGGTERQNYKIVEGYPNRSKIDTVSETKSSPSRSGTRTPQDDKIVFPDPKTDKFYFLEALTPMRQDHPNPPSSSTRDPGATSTPSRTPSSPRTRNAKIYSIIRERSRRDRTSKTDPGVRRPNPNPRIMDSATQTVVDRKLDRLPFQCGCICERTACSVQCSTSTQMASCEVAELPRCPSTGQVPAVLASLCWRFPEEHGCWPHRGHIPVSRDSDSIRDFFSLDAHCDAQVLELANSLECDGLEVDSVLLLRRISTLEQRLRSLWTVYLSKFNREG